MESNILKLLLIFFLALIQFSCGGTSRGKVKVISSVNGTYDIYKIASTSPLQFVSETIGKFNEDVDLKPGEYLILSDCSSETVVVRPNNRITLISHQITFIPPIPPAPEDKFTIQCDRYVETKSRQYLNNQYTLNILNGKREILVGMDPFILDLEKVGFSGSPQKLSFNLAAIQVNSYEGMPPKTNYFISPTGGRLSFTEIQEFGKWQFLLPGKYQVEVNGTKMDISLTDQEKKVINPAFLKVSVSPTVNLNLSSQIQGSPLYVELNGSHWLDLNETYPVLPGTMTIRLTNSNIPFEVNLQEGETLVKPARSVMVENDCSPWQWNCLGGINVFLYEKDKTYSFAKGTTDVPILFFIEDVSVMVEGSRNILYQLPNKQDTNLKIGKVKFVPSYSHKPGLITDLARVESTGTPTRGHSLDLVLDHESVMPLVAGTYKFTQYTLVTSTDGNRSKSEIPLHVRPGSTLTVPYTVLLNEKKFAAYRESLESQEKSKGKKYNLSRVPYHPIAPFSVE